MAVEIIEDKKHGFRDIINYNQVTNIRFKNKEEKKRVEWEEFRENKVIAVFYLTSGSIFTTEIDAKEEKNIMEKLKRSQETDEEIKTRKKEEAEERRYREKEKEFTARFKEKEHRG